METSIANLNNLRSEIGKISNRKQEIEKYLMETSQANLNTLRQEIGKISNRKKEIRKIGNRKTSNGNVRTKSEQFEIGNRKNVPTSKLTKTMTMTLTNKQDKDKECQKYLMETSEPNLNNLRSEIGKMSPCIRWRHFSYLLLPVF